MVLDIYNQGSQLRYRHAFHSSFSSIKSTDAEFHTGRRFKFECFWPKAEGFQQVVASAWNSIPSEGNPFAVLDNKLRATAKALQSWSDRWIGNVCLQIGIAMEIIGRLDVASEGRQLSDQEHGLRKVLKRKLLGLSSLDRTIARQRARLLQLSEGDANTGFFHRQAKHRQRKNVITSLQHNSEIFMGRDNITDVVDDYYEELLGATTSREVAVNLDILDLPSHDLAHLEAPFTMEEVEKTIKAMPLDKAPGPDGFTGRFYVVCWQTIREDFMRALEHFHKGDMRGLAAINKAVVSLLPKKDGVVDIKDYRPVSLVHGAIKIYDKILATRLADDLPRLVGHHQSAFIRGRSMHDNFMLVQCMARWLHALRRPTIMLKLDITKAFDSVRWPFVLEVLRRF